MVIIPGTFNIMQNIMHGLLQHGGFDDVVSPIIDEAQNCDADTGVKARRW